jgi:hypothetical protein
MAHIRVYRTEFKITFSPSSAGASVFGDLSGNLTLIAPRYSFAKTGGPTLKDSAKLEEGTTIEMLRSCTIDVDVPGDFQYVNPLRLTIMNIENGKHMDAIDLMNKVHDHVEGYRVTKIQYESEAGS